MDVQSAKSNLKKVVRFLGVKSLRWIDAPDAGYRAERIRIFNSSSCFMLVATANRPKKRRNFDLFSAFYSSVVWSSMKQKKYKIFQIDIDSKP